ncbi:MAG: hypothetical protein ACRDSE_04680, partial [Pseudonocardiaceae bacterium]
MTSPENTERGTEAEGQGRGSSGSVSPPWQRVAEDGLHGAVSEGNTAYLPKVGDNPAAGERWQARDEDRNSHTGELPVVTGSAANRLFGSFESDV